MKILVANIPLPQNRFLVDLNQAISCRVELTHDEKLFWNRQGNFDIVHLHFPEYMTFHHEEQYASGLQDSLIEETRSCLQWWSERARIVITRHVLLPHDALQDPQWEKMYEAVYQYCDGVVHFATASIDEFKNRYSKTEFYHNHPIHFVIPHHNYASLPNTIQRDEARAKLGIPLDRKVMLVFGAIRNMEERSLILETFQSLKIHHKLLLVSRWKEQLVNVRWIRLKYWLRDLSRLYYRLHPNYHFNYGFVDEADTQIYLNAADLLFIPRLKVLNSGNITLGMTFGKVVVGPDSWDVGQLLKETGNPVFDPNHPATAAKAVEKGFSLAAEGKIGQANQTLALNEWSATQCAEKYLQFYQEVRNRMLPAKPANHC